MNGMRFSPASDKKEANNFVSKETIVEIYAEPRELAATMALLTNVPFRDHDLIIAPANGFLSIATNHKDDIVMIMMIIDNISSEWAWKEVKEDGRWKI